MFDFHAMPTLLALKAAAAAGSPLVVGQLGQSLDGRIATASGHSHYVNGPEAIAFLHHLRAHVDAVVVGAGTALADDPQLTVRCCAGPSPARILIDGKRRSGPGLRMLRSADGAGRLVFGARLPDDPPDVEHVVPSANAPLAPEAILAVLAERGWHRVLIEGGAHTVSAFLAAGALSRLCVAVAPLIIGGGPGGIALPPVDRLDSALRPETKTFMLPAGDVIFDCTL
ncbi:RibD family protein [Acuticoccus sp. MNP-M23]|uniref:RibD family protein n=1 Tax=Acuticoccus sp. MNP-M23 TaxID=3072793 RepID=UPI002814A6F2|nr:RibD family protein [Acuticoccus sp. MNP-M23]WMS43268.1 RibD family protein [Acuticoccus sp. MNP-M23]